MKDSDTDTLSTWRVALKRITKRDLTSGTGHENRKGKTGLTSRPLLIQTPFSKAVHQLDLVVLVPTSPRGLEELDACGQLHVVVVVVPPGSERQLQLFVELRQIIQIHTTQSLQPVAEDKSESRNAW